MSDTIALWRAEHANFAKLMDLLEDQLDVFHDGRDPDYDLMLAITYYMIHFPDLFHHPREDQVFALIRQRDSGAAALVDALTQQHLRIARDGGALVRDLEEIVNGSLLSRERVEAAGRNYIAQFRHHMRQEDTEAIPLAAKLLRAKDWKAIGSAIRQVEDPIFGKTAELRYSAIREQIERRQAVAGKP